MQTSRWFATVVLILVAPTSVGCGVPRSGDRRAQPEMSASVAMEIRPAEIDALRERVSSVYDLIRRLRPAMLNSRDPSASPMEAPYAPLAAPFPPHPCGFHVDEGDSFCPLARRLARGLHITILVSAKRRLLALAIAAGMAHMRVQK